MTTMRATASDDVDVGFDGEYAILRAEPSDEAFIFSSWLNGHWPVSGEFVPTVPGAIGGRNERYKAAWMARHHELIERILAHEKTVTLVATIVEVPGSLAGFVCSADDCLHWGYVKQPFRRYGIFRSLMRELDQGASTSLTCSHWSPHLGRAFWHFDPRKLERYE